MAHLPRRLLTALLPAIAAGIFAQAQADPNAGLPVAQLAIGLYQIRAEVAATPSARETGLMFRQSMPDTLGMLFVFEQSARHCFWMKNTRLPLSIAFIDDHGIITDIADMTPQTEDRHCPTQPARYALEMNQGWFAKKRIRAGAKVQALPRAN